jgi:hypothetical protein
VAVSICPSVWRAVHRDALRWLVLLLIPFELTRAQGGDTIQVNEGIGFLTRQTDRGVSLSRGMVIEPNVGVTFYGISLAASGYYGFYDTTPGRTVGEFAFLGGYHFRVRGFEFLPNLKYRRRPLETDNNILEATVSAGYPLGPLKLVVANAVAWPGAPLAYYGDAIASGRWNPLPDFELAADASVGWGSPGYHARRMYAGIWAFDHLTGDISLAYTFLDVFRLCPSVSFNTMLDPDLAAGLRARNRLAGLSAGFTIEATLSSETPGTDIRF